MNEREALKRALEALDCICSPLHVREITKVGNAMKAIREALAQPEQEPDDLTIAYMTGFHAGKNTPQPKPLTDKQIDKMIAANLETWNSKSAMVSFVRAIEAAHGIKGEA